MGEGKEGGKEGKRKVGGKGEMKGKDEQVGDVGREGEKWEGRGRE